MVFEVVFFFLSLFALGLWLLLSDTAGQWRRYWRARRVGRLLRSIEGGEVVRAEQLLGPPREILTGSGGRSLYVWKGPESRSIPRAAPLLIITLTVDAAGKISHAAWEER